MAISSAIVLFAVVWFMVLFVVLPLRLTTQGDANDVVPGTPAGAPVNAQIRRKIVITTLAAFVVWGVIAGVIASGIITIDDIDVLNHMGN